MNWIKKIFGKEEVREKVSEALSPKDNEWVINFVKENAPTEMLDSFLDSCLTYSTSFYPAGIYEDGREKIDGEDHVAYITFFGDELIKNGYVTGWISYSKMRKGEKITKQTVDVTIHPLKPIKIFKINERLCEDKVDTDYKVVCEKNGKETYHSFSSKEDALSYLYTRCDNCDKAYMIGYNPYGPLGNDNDR